MVEGGVSLDEKAALGRYMRERTAIERILEEARDGGDPKNKK